MLTITNEDNMQLMARYPDNYFDLAIVDPPYGIGFDGEVESMVLAEGKRGKNRKLKGYKRKEWDNEKPNKQYFDELFRVSKNQIIWGGNHYELPQSSGWIVWNKLKPHTWSLAPCELAWSSFGGACRMFDFLWHGFAKGQSADNDSRFHPTQKPVALYKWLLDKYAKQGDKILDTHLGSGSIAIACHDYGFDLTACELDKEYFDKAMQRITNHTNQLNLFI